MKFKNVINAFKNVVTKDKKEAKSLESPQARIVISKLSYNNSIIVIDENGESNTPPIPDPVEEELLVKSGDQVSGFEILKITTNFIELKSFIEYTMGNDYTPKTHFIVEKGEEINLNMYGVCDAVHKTSVKYIEKVELP